MTSAATQIIQKNNYSGNQTAWFIGATGTPTQKSWMNSAIKANNLNRLFEILNLPANFVIFRIQVTRSKHSSFLRAGCGHWPSNTLHNPFARFSHNSMIKNVLHLCSDTDSAWWQVKFTSSSGCNMLYLCILHASCCIYISYVMGRGPYPYPIHNKLWRFQCETILSPFQMYNWFSVF